MAIMENKKKRSMLNTNIKTNVDLKSKTHKEFNYLAKLIKSYK